MLWGGAAVEDNQNGYVDMYRLYNPNSGEHFYTANPAEKNNLVSLGWRYEGIGWTAPKKSNTPVYRLYNPNSGDHHYTVNVDIPNTTDKPSDTQNPNTKPSTVHTHSWSPVKEDFEFIDQYDEYWESYDDGYTCKHGEVTAGDISHGGSCLVTRTIYVDKIIQYQVCSCGEKKVINSYIKYEYSDTGETWTE